LAGPAHHHRSRPPAKLRRALEAIKSTRGRCAYNERISNCPVASVRGGLIVASRAVVAGTNSRPRSGTTTMRRVEMTMPVVRGRLAGIAAVCAGLAILTSACASHTPGPGSTASPGAVVPATPASNGIAAKPAAKIVKTAFTTLESAESVRVYGSFRDSGARYKLDVTMGPGGMRGTMTAPFHGAKLATVDMVLTHGKFYARSSTLWRQVGGAGLASLIGDRWVILPASKLSGFPF